MAKKRAAWWWIDRWRKSTAFTDMTLAEQGAYRNLIDELWLRGGVLPNDERILAKICGDAMAWPSVRHAVLQRFDVTADGLRNATHDEVSGQGTFSKSQSDKGKKGAEARWKKKRGQTATDSPANGPAINKDGPANGPLDGPGMASVLRTPYSVSVVPSPSPESGRESESGVSGPARPPARATSSGIDYNPDNPDHVELVAACEGLAQESGSTALEILRAVSTPKGGEQFLDGLFFASAEWVAVSLQIAKSDRFRSELLHEEGPERMTLRDRTVESELGGRVLRDDFLIDPDEQPP